MRINIITGNKVRLDCIKILSTFNNQTGMDKEKPLEKLLLNSFKSGCLL